MCHKHQYMFYRCEAGAAGPILPLRRRCSFRSCHLPCSYSPGVIGQLDLLSGMDLYNGYEFPWPLNPLLTRSHRPLCYKLSRYFLHLPKAFCILYSTDVHQLPMNSAILEAKAHISQNPDLFIFITARFSYKMVDVTLRNYTGTTWNKLKAILLPASLNPIGFSLSTCKEKLQQIITDYLLSTGHYTGIFFHILSHLILKLRDKSIVFLYMRKVRL